MYFSWLLEFLLESVALAFSIRKRNWTLSALLAVRVVADLITCAARHQSHYAYAQLFWLFRAGQYLLLLWLACVICGKLLQELNQARVRITAAIIAVIGSMAVLKLYSDGLTIDARFMDAEIAANFILAAVLFSGWVSRNVFFGRGLDRQWNWILLGLVIQLASRALCTMAWMRWNTAAYWFYAGDIAALSIWIAAVSRKVEEVSYFRLDSIGSPNAEPLIDEEIKEARVM